MLSKIIKRTGATLQGNGNYYGLDRFGIINKNILANLSVSEIYDIAT